MAQKCIYKNPETGESCGAYSLKDKKFCFWHDPEIPDHTKLEARRKGGARKPSLPERSLKTPGEVAAHLEEKTNSVRSEKIDKTKAALLNNLSGNLLKALELADLDSRLQAMEEYVR